MSEMEPGLTEAVAMTMAWDPTQKEAQALLLWASQAYCTLLGMQVVGGLSERGQSVVEHLVSSAPALPAVIGSSLFGVAADRAEREAP